MRTLLQTFFGETVLVFTSLGHTYVGTVSDIDNVLVELTAVNGGSRLHIQLSDISGVRLYEEEA